jgi:hypothetical protein
MVNPPLTNLVADCRVAGLRGDGSPGAVQEHDHGDAFGTGSR